MLGKFSSRLKDLRGNRVEAAFLALIAISFLARLLIVLNFRARASWDTASYVRVAHAIATRDFSGYDGNRTPVFPLLLLLAGMDWDVVRLLQSLLGIAIAAIMFAVAWTRTRSAAAAFAIGLLSSLAASELLFEQIIYSETLCTFWIALSLLAYARIDAAGARVGNYALLGLAAALAGMTRPMFLFLGPLYFCFAAARTRKLRDMRVAWVLAPTLVLAIGWSAVNQHTLNYFGVTTTTGFNLSNHSGAFMELAPPQYSKIADIYLRYRAVQIERMGSQTMTIWLAGAEIQRKTGLTTAELSKQLTRMSLEMFAQHPLLYLASVARAWGRFWGFGIFRDMGYFQAATGNRIFYAVAYAMGALQWAISVTFLLVAGYSSAQWMRRRIVFSFDLGVIAIVLTASVVQAFLEYGENIRYLVPLVPLTIYTVGIFLWRRVAREP